MKDLVDANERAPASRATAGQPEPRRHPPNDAGDLGQHVGQPHILAAQDIQFPDPAALEGGEMPGGDVVDMDQVEGGVDIARHAARRGFDDDPRPVGVGRMSRGPIGVDGLTMTAGRPRAVAMACTRRSAATLLRL